MDAKPCPTPMTSMRGASPVRRNHAPAQEPKGFAWPLCGGVDTSTRSGSQRGKVKYAGLGPGKPGHCEGLVLEDFEIPPPVLDVGLEKLSLLHVRRTDKNGKPRSTGQFEVDRVLRQGLQQLGELQVYRGCLMVQEVAHAAVGETLVKHPADDLPPGRGMHPS